MHAVHGGAESACTGHCSVLPPLLLPVQRWKPLHG